ncbi:unnamed protein product [Lactuca virosa]|uniref:Uncharacterized protein n=1 Tax=Lactuca virosa TaxID=75947 RepID=A0AAU9NFJ8_9ASTR|nr:unnamed protein product [Lactuca virosa]
MIFSNTQYPCTLLAGHHHCRVQGSNMDCWRCVPIHRYRFIYPFLYSVLVVVQNVKTCSGVALCDPFVIRVFDLQIQPLLLCKLWEFHKTIRKMENRLNLKAMDAEQLLDNMGTRWLLSLPITTKL